MTKLQQLFSKKFPQLQPQFDYPLASHTYMKIGGPAEIFVQLTSVEMIVEVVTFCRDEQIPLTVLGGASNVIIADTGLRGVVVTLNNQEYEVVGHNNDLTILRVGAGFKMAPLVRKTVDDGLTGLEYFLGVPGKLGGSIYNNAHYLSDLIGNFVSQVEVLDASNNLRWVSQKDCQFAYDQSVFQQTRDLILAVEFALPKGNLDESQQKITKATEYRAQTQPLGEPSSGCYFRNVTNTPELQKQFPQFAERREMPSGFLIDQAGLKGVHFGDIEISQKHAAFFVNKGHGTSDDVLHLAEMVKQKIKEKFNVALHEEVFFLSN